MFVTPPPALADQPSEPHADCSTSRVAPVIDGIIAGVQVIRTVYTTQTPDSTYQGKAPISRGTEFALNAGSAGLFLASTIYGAVNTSKCEAYKARSEEADRAEKRERAKANGYRVTPEPEPEEKADSAQPRVEAAPPAAAPLHFTSTPKSGGSLPP